jgi:hypothetical protein
MIRHEQVAEFVRDDVLDATTWCLHKQWIQCDDA